MQIPVKIVDREIRKAYGITNNLYDFIRYLGGTEKLRLYNVRLGLDEYDFNKRVEIEAIEEYKVFMPLRIKRIVGITERHERIYIIILSDYNPCLRYSYKGISSALEIYRRTIKKGE